MIRSTNWILIIVGAALVLMEVLLGAVSGFDFLLIGSAVLAGGLLGILTHSPAVGVATAGILSLAYVLLGRKRIRARLRRPGLSSNTDALLGRTMLVSEPIAKDRAGRVKWEGEEWRAMAEGTVPLETGRSVRVVRIEGVTLFVVPAEADPSAGGGMS
jgi:membrane protein implicated in regulation of membrane protease activity